MTRMKKFSSLVFGLAALSLTVACASDVDDPDDNGGNGTGAAPGSGGGSNPSPGGGGGSTQPPNTGGGNGGGGQQPSSGSFTRDEMGRFMGGNVAGYGFAYISDENGVSTDLAKPTDTATNICGQGSLPTSYEAVGGIGVNVNQPAPEPGAAAAGPPQAYAGTVSSITVEYTNVAGSTLRVQATTTSGQNFCKALPAGTSATVTPADLNSKCWDGTGEAWDGTALESVQLIIPGDEAAAVSFNACLNGVSVQ